MNSNNDNSLSNWIQRIGEIHAIIVMAAASSAAVALFIRFPKAGMFGLLGFLTVSIVLTVVQHVKPAAAGSLRGHMAVIATAPVRMFFLATLTGFLVLALLTAPIIWLCFAGYATFLVVAQLRSERKVEVTEPVAAAPALTPEEQKAADAETNRLIGEDFDKAWDKAGPKA